MSSFDTVTKSWDSLLSRADQLFKRQKKRFYVLHKVLHEQRLAIYVDRESQQVLLKVSIDIRFKRVLEKDTTMLDIFSQDAIIAEQVKQLDDFKTLAENLTLYRESERSSTVYSRLSN